MSKKKNNKNSFLKSDVSRKRKFPILSILFLFFLITIQIGLILFSVFCVSESVQDVIDSYNITVEPQKDGTLKLDYNFIWETVDKNEKLSWVDIGMPNNDYGVEFTSLSENISSYSKISDDGYTALRLFFAESYIGGDVFDFSFTVYQKNILCKNENGYFYEFVPSWFNRTPVEQYNIRWKSSESIINSDYIVGSDGYILWQDSLSCGEYIRIFVQYNDSAFDGNAGISEYIPFDAVGVYNGLYEDTIVQRVIIGGFVLLIGFVQLQIIDSFVSYVRGRGFLRKQGQYMHLHGGMNPIFSRINNNYGTGQRGDHHRGGMGSGRSSGCACACACACAGGGRAGCSRKDTNSFPKN